MKISAVITEYNPMHNGHIYHLNETQNKTNCDGLICVVSGNFTQRGTPSIMDKWTRAEIAVLSGVDLVLELPTIYATSSAEFFAHGAVSLLNSLNIVDNLCFGSENGDIDTLYKIADIISTEPKEYVSSLKNYIDTGVPFFTARNNALSDFFNTNKSSLLGDILSSPNNILGIEYCKSIIKLNSSIKPVTIKRSGSGYNNNKIETNFPSASSLRESLYKNYDLKTLQKYVPEYTYKMLSQMIKNGFDFPSNDKMVPFIKYKALTEKNNIKCLPDASEGLHNKILNSIENFDTFDKIVLNSKSKRYSYTRISRILCQYFIGLEKYNTAILRKQNCPYARVLAFNEKGRSILKEIKNSASIPLYTKLSKVNSNPFLDIDLQSTRAYSTISKNINAFDDYKISPIYIR
ncbi:MAG: nucleotidyltransferase [Clostridium sp.]|nr:nucleotidyltransferase [Clostridium sp.]